MTLTLADVSEFQTVDWAKYGAANPVVIIRAAVTYWSKTQNKTVYRADNKFAANLAGARAHTQVRGFYQYMDATADPAVAARSFMAVVGPLQPGEFVILDIEEGAGDQRGRRQTWLNTVRGLNKTVIEWTYTGMWFARQHLSGVRVDWMAAYQGAEPTDAHSLWQSTDKQSFAGISAPCDGSRYNGTLDQLKALVGAAPAKPSTPATKPPAKPAAPVNHNTGNQATEKPWGSFPLPAGEWYGVASPNPKNHSGYWAKDQRAVKQIQREVGVAATGHFDANTETAVKHWQSTHGLKGDGGVGGVTWLKMTQTN